MKKYGIYVLVCDCGWQTTSTKASPEPPTKCAACGKDGTARFDQEIACVVATFAEIRSQRICEHAKKSDLMVYQLSKNRWVVLRNTHTSSVTYADKAVRAFNVMEAVCGPADWQTVMQYIRDHTPELPAYLM